MEISKPEVGAVAHVEELITELEELQLALVGGGVGEVVLA
jgi:hypothetical protein